jgi:flagellar export protein FliJ
MPFHFPLDSVLRLRLGQERMERLKLEAIASELAQAGRQLGFITDRGMDARRRFREQMSHETYGSELHFEETAEERMEAVRRAMEIRVAQLEQERLKQVEVYKKSRRRRETLENVREQKLAAYIQTMGRREQQQLDDLFLMRQGTQSNE